MSSPSIRKIRVYIWSSRKTIIFNQYEIQTQKRRGLGYLQIVLLSALFWFRWSKVNTPCFGGVRLGSTMGVKFFSDTNCVTFSDLLYCLLLKSFWFSSLKINNIIEMIIHPHIESDTIFVTTEVQALYGPWSSMPVTENSSLLFSSCHLELVTSENSWFFAYYFDK